MAESGLVIAKDGDRVTVRMERTEACAKCKACMAGFSKQEMIIRAVNTCGAEVNDTVNIELEETGFLSAVLIMYGVPLIFMLLGFVAGYVFAPKIGAPVDGEVAGFALGILFMLLAYFLIKLSEGRRDTEKYTPVATGIVKE